MKTSVKIDSELVNKLKVLKNKKGTSLTWMLERAVSNWLIKTTLLDFSKTKRVGDEKNKK